jgi:hypothetical protein
VDNILLFSRERERESERERERERRERVRACVLISVRADVLMMYTLKKTRAQIRERADTQADTSAYMQARTTTSSNNHNQSVSRLALEDGRTDGLNPNLLSPQMDFTVKGVKVSNTKCPYVLCLYPCFQC